MFRTVALFFALLLFFPLFPLLVVFVAFLLFVLLFVGVEAGRFQGRLFRLIGRDAFLVFVFLMLILMLPSGGRFQVLVLFRKGSRVQTESSQLYACERK